jgi:hypothetical protein
MCWDFSISCRHYLVLLRRLLLLSAASLCCLDVTMHSTFLEICRIRLSELPVPRYHEITAHFIFREQSKLDTRNMENQPAFADGTSPLRFRQWLKFYHVVMKRSSEMTTIFIHKVFHAVYRDN